MAGNEIRLNHSELAKILKSPEVMSALHDIADRIVAAHSNPGDLEIEEYEGRTRNRVSVKTVNVRAHVREARNHGLVQALGSVQGG